jgi:tetratricopeptide (TPR) repeat protein
MLRLIVTLAVCAGAGPGLARAQTQPAAPVTYSGVSVEPSEQIFAIMCALDASGFGADDSTLGEMPGRLALRSDLLKLKGPAANALRDFYRSHALADPGENLSRYIAFALVAGPPPNFALQMEREMLPPEVLSIDGFQDVLADFYREANLNARWGRLDLEHQRLLGRYQVSVARIVENANAYLREVVRPSRSLTFTVYVEPLVGNRTIASNTGDHYAIVTGSTSEIPVDDIQHAYLHFLLDPIALRNRQAIEAKQALLNIAARAPKLPVEYRDDFVALADECFIKSVELRLRRLPPDQLEAALEDDDLSGYILVRPFVLQLKVFEKSDPSMSYYFGDLIAGVDVAIEQKRFQGVTFPAAAPAAAAGDQAKTSSEEKINDHKSDVDRLLDQGDREIATQNVGAARLTFQKVLKQNPDEPRAIYGLAITSVLSGDAPQAKDLFERLVSPAPESGAAASRTPVEPSLVAWSHIYLGRIHDLEGDRSSAVGEYKAALGVDGAPESARVAAQRGMDAAYNAQPAPSNGGAQKP